MRKCKPAACHCSCEVGKGDQRGGSAIPDRRESETAGDGSSDRRADYCIAEWCEAGRSMGLMGNPMVCRQTRKPMSNCELGPGNRTSRLDKRKASGGCEAGRVAVDKKVGALHTKAEGSFGSDVESGDCGRRGSITGGGFVEGSRLGQRMAESPPNESETCRGAGEREMEPLHQGNNQSMVRRALASTQWENRRLLCWCSPGRREC
jgi:hypothetical protein